MAVGRFVAVALLAICLPAIGQGGSFDPAALAEDPAHLLPLPDQVIALIALGLAMGRLASDCGPESFAVHGVALFAGLVGGLLSVPPEQMALRAIALAVGGLLLLDPGNGVRKFPRTAIAFATLPAGLSYGSALPPTSGAPLFLGVAFAMAVILGVGAMQLWERFYQPWFRIAIRIAGSWMIAIGTILLGAALR